jgi:LPS-assembly lipoprotein
MRQLLTIVFFSVALVLAGCTARPLYGARADGQGVAAVLAGVRVEEQKSRAGQIVRNNLLSAMGSGGESRYLLRLMPDEGDQQISSVASQKLARHRYKLSMKYELADAASGGVLVSGSSFSTVSYDTVEQPIADLKAAENARDRAGREVAEDIRLRLAAYFASR